MNPKNAYDEFMLTKQLWGKDQEGKRMCMHYIQSFKPGEVTPELAKQIADEFVKQKIFKGFRFLMLFIQIRIIFIRTLY